MWGKPPWRTVPLALLRDEGPQSLARGQPLGCQQYVSLETLLISRKILTRLVILHKIIEADLTNSAFYRPYLVEFALDLLDKEDDLKESSVKLGLLL